MNKQPIFSIKNLVKKFDEHIVLNDVDLDIYDEESIVILGPSGVGKSVFLKILLHLMKQDSGYVKFKGKQMDLMSGVELKKFYRSIGVLFQDSALFDSFPVWKNVMFGPMMNDNVSEYDAKIKANELLQSVGLSSDDLAKDISELSGGMRKRVALARAIASVPEVLFFDEPTTGLDPIMSNTIISLIQKHIRNLHATAITITHDLLVAKQIADRILMFDNGKIVFDGSYDQLLKDSSSVVMQFLKPWRDANFLR